MPLFNILIAFNRGLDRASTLCRALLADELLVTWRMPIRRYRGFNDNVQGSSGPWFDECVFTTTCALLGGLARPGPLIVRGFNTQYRIQKATAPNVPSSDRF